MLLTLKRSLTACAVALMLGLSGTGMDARAETALSCSGEQAKCDASCAARYTSDAGKAGCQARCASARAACDAGAGYDQAKPWVKKKVQSVGDFFQGLTEGGDSGTPSEPPPAKPAPAKN